MEFEVIPALLGGLLATVVMSAMMAGARSAGLTDMPSIPILAGSMLTREPGAARNLELFIHYLVMGTVVFGLAYATAFVLLDSATLVTGGLIGLVHGVLVGLVLGVMPTIHPRMAPVNAGEVATVRFDDQGVHLAASGFFGLEWGGLTPVALLVGHVLYGVVVAAVYSAAV